MSKIKLVGVAILALVLMFLFGAGARKVAKKVRKFWRRRSGGRRRLDPMKGARQAASRAAQYAGEAECAQRECQANRQSVLEVRDQTEDHREAASKSAGRAEAAAEDARKARDEIQALLAKLALTADRRG